MDRSIYKRLYKLVSDYWPFLVLSSLSAFIYVAFKAYRDEVVSSIHSRDNFSLYSEDYVNIHLDTYGDARNNIGLSTNLFGSQNDGIRVEASGFGSRTDGWSLDANFDFKSLTNTVITFSSF